MRAGTVTDFDLDDLFGMIDADAGVVGGQR